MSADAAIEAAALVPEVPAVSEEAPATAPGEIPPAPPTDLDPLPRSAGQYGASGPEWDQVAIAPVADADTQRDRALIEALAGLPAPVARVEAKQALAARDAPASYEDVTSPARVDPSELQDVIEGLIAELVAMDAPSN